MKRTYNGTFSALLNVRYAEIVKKMDFVKQHGKHLLRLCVFELRWLPISFTETGDILS